MQLVKKNSQMLKEKEKQEATQQDEDMQKKYEQCDV